MGRMWYLVGGWVRADDLIGVWMGGLGVVWSVGCVG